MAYTTINKSTDYFNTVLYTGNGGTQSITGVGFQPNLNWIKNRSDGTSHFLYDIIRGAGNNKDLRSNSTGAEGSGDGATHGFMSAFTSDGFTVTQGSSTASITNASGDTYASWNWKANGAGSANTDGSISSTVSANTTSGFSIVKYTGNGTGNSTIGHGLGATPKFIIVKNLTTAQDWGTYSPSFVSASDPNVLYLGKTDAGQVATNVWGTSASFNNNTFTVGDWTGSNQSGSSFIAYCFAEKQGFSKIGSYVGNGSSDGSYIHLGFNPSWILVKSSSAGSTGWNILDNKRDPENVMDTILQPNNSNADANDANKYCDFLSNGFKWRASGGETNGSGTTYIYMAFAEAPLVGSNNVPCTAR